MNVPFFRLHCDGNELKYIRDVLESGWLTTGGKALDFEAAFAQAVGAKHALAVNSCTAALHLGCEAAGVGPGSEVLVPSLTFTATAEVVEYLGGKVRLADVDPKTGLLDPQRLTESLERHPNITCVMPVHFAGRTARMRGTEEQPGIMDICDRNGISVVEDAAHAFPAEYADGSPVGSGIGSIATCFSFYANKTITTGEGGMLCTNDDEIATRARRMRLHGIDRTIWDRFTETKAKWEYDVIAPGYKYNLPDLAAAVGLAQLERAEEFRIERTRVVAEYRKRLEDHDLLRLPAPEDHRGSHAWHLFVIHLAPELDRNAFIDKLTEHGIGSSVHYKPLHRMNYWEKRIGETADAFPGAESWWRSCVSLPLFPGMKTEEIDAVCDSVAASLALTREAAH